MYARRICIALTVAAAASLAPLAFADPPPRRIDVSHAIDAGAPPPPSDIVVSKIPPDPPAMRERAQWIFDLRWSKGDVFLLGEHAIDLGAPQLTPRVMGRFALELYEGPTLIERVRFDFPLLGAPTPPDAGIALENNLTTRIGVMFPATKRGTRLELWDRATDKRWPLPWPPTDTRAAAARDAGAAPDGGAR